MIHPLRSEPQELFCDLQGNLKDGNRHLWRTARRFAAPGGGFLRAAGLRSGGRSRRGFMASRSARIHAAGSDSRRPCVGVSPACGGRCRAVTRRKDPNCDAICTFFLDAAMEFARSDFMGQIKRDAGAPLGGGTTRSGSRQANCCIWCVRLWGVAAGSGGGAKGNPDLVPISPTSFTNERGVPLRTTADGQDRADRMHP